MEHFPTIVVDLDGTLCNCSHRAHHAANGNWDEFHETLLEDEVFRDVEILIQSMFNVNMDVVVVTGRPEKYRNLTEEWLDRNDIACIDAILMRPDNNWEHDKDLKVKMLEEYFGSKEETLKNVVFVLDDREAVVEAWRNYGLSCWQVRLGEY